MKRNLIYIALLLIAAQGAWADVTPSTMNPAPIEGPWTYLEVNTQTNGGSTTKPDVVSYNNLDGDCWDDVVQFQDNNYGTGFKLEGGRNSGTYQFGVFSIYFHHENVPAYTRKQMIWKYKLFAHVEIYNLCAALYAHKDLAVLKNTPVDFSYAYENPYSGRDYYLAYLMVASYNSEYSTRRVETPEKTAFFDFDNRTGSTEQTKSWYLMLTEYIEDVKNISQSEGSETHYGSFKHKGAVSWVDYYYKHITFHANGGAGSMDTQTIENNGNLTANAFTRENYAFVGWATAEDGEVVYADKAAITATESDKGLVDLYAVWTPAPTSVMDLIDAIGTVEYSDACRDKMTAAHEAYYALDNALKPYVTNYSVLISSEASYVVRKTEALIDSIGTVVHTDACKAKMEAARMAFNGLTKATEPLVSNYSTLLEAEAAYAEMEKTAFVMLNKGKEPMGDAQNKELDYPAAPDVQDKTFLHWEPVAEQISDTILIKAVYSEQNQ